MRIEISSEELRDWIDALMIAYPGFGRRSVFRMTTPKSKFFYNWFLDMLAQWSRR